MDIKLEALGPDHPDLATIWNNMAGVYKAQGDMDKVLELYQRAADIEA